MAQPNYGDLLVVDTHRKLFSVDPSTGASTIITNFSDNSYGPTASLPLGLAIDSSGNILILVYEVYVLPSGFSNYALFTVNPTSGKREIDRKSTRLNSSHVAISYAVFCLKKKKKKYNK